jgi:hypothetical protein
MAGLKRQHTIIIKEFGMVKMALVWSEFGVYELWI